MKKKKGIFEIFLDIVIVVGYVLDMSYIITADLNVDGIINILDIVILTGVILNE